MTASRASAVVRGFIGKIHEDGPRRPRLDETAGDIAATGEGSTSATKNTGSKNNQHKFQWLEKTAAGISNHWT